MLPADAICIAIVLFRCHSCVAVFAALLHIEAVYACRLKLYIWNPTLHASYEMVECALTSIMLQHDALILICIAMSTGTYSQHMYAYCG